MSTMGPVESDIVVSLARGRYAVMSRASDLLGTVRDTGAVNDSDLAAVSGLLMTALEELKVAEEELRAQNATLEAQRAGIDERTRYYRNLFLYAPLAALITDTRGTIVEVNAQAAALTRRAANHLERKPLAALVPMEERDVFRREFARLLSLDDGVNDWQFQLTRVGDVPVTVHATVRLVRQPDHPLRSDLFYWMLREGAATTI